MQETSDFSILLKDMDGTNGELKQFARMVCIKHTVILIYGQVSVINWLRL